MVMLLIYKGALDKRLSESRPLDAEKEGIIACGAPLGGC